METSIYCPRKGCAHNDCYACSAEHIRLDSEGRCASFLDWVDAQKREIELRCQPFNLETPFVLICRSNAGDIPLEMTDLGFRRQVEPPTGIMGVFGKGTSDQPVWVLVAASEQKDTALQAVEQRGYRVMNFILPEESSAMERAKRYSSMSKADKENALLQLSCPSKPSIIRRGFWNGKIYGSEGKESIWLDGEKVNLSPEQAVAIRKYQADMAQYESERGNLLRYG